MPKVIIGGETYEATPLEPAQFLRYTFLIADLANSMLNPWEELYHKVKTLPANLQEIAFWRLYHENWRAVSELDTYRIGQLLGPATTLAGMMLGEDGPEVTRDNAAQVFQALYPHIKKGEEREVSPAEAAGIMRRQADREERMPDD